MADDAEHLPALIDQAISALAKARTAAEVLSARERAAGAYDAAKRAARLAKISDAHGTVLAACRKAQADALGIEAVAQCRLADEYDAAQERGEVARHGELGRGKNRPSKREGLSTVADIGLTYKEIHEARQVRDAEKRKPGVVRKTLEAKLKAGEEPTHADVRRAVKDTNKGPKPQRRKFGQEVEDRAASLVLDEGKSYDEAGTAVGVSNIVIRTSVAREQGRREARADPQIDPAALSLSAQQKLEAAIRQHKRKLDAELAEQREQLRAELDRYKIEWLRGNFVAGLNERQAEYDAVILARKGVMSRKVFDKIRRCLHPDSRQSASDERLAEAFRLFSRLETRLLDEKDLPTKRFKPLTVADVLEARLKAEEERRAKHAAKRDGQDLTRR